MYRTFLADVLFTERHRLALISGCFAFHDLWSCGLCPTPQKLQHIPPYSKFNSALVAAINPRHQSHSRSSNSPTHASAPDAVNSIHVSSPSFINTYFRVSKSGKTNKPPHELATPKTLIPPILNFTGPVSYLVFLIPSLGMTSDGKLHCTLLSGLINLLFSLHSPTFFFCSLCTHVDR